MSEKQLYALIFWVKICNESKKSFFLLPSFSSTFQWYCKPLWHFFIFFCVPWPNQSSQCSPSDRWVLGMAQAVMIVIKWLDLLSHHLISPLLSRQLKLHLPGCVRRKWGWLLGTYCSDELVRRVTSFVHVMMPSLLATVYGQHRTTGHWPVCL